MNTFLSLASAAISAGNFCMNAFINQKQNKQKKNVRMTSIVMIGFAIIFSVGNSMYIISKVEKNGCK